MIDRACVRLNLVRRVAQPVLLAAVSVLTAAGQTLFTVTAPTEGQVFQPGDVVTVRIAAESGVTLQGLEVVSLLGWKIAESVAPISLTIPASYSFGPVRLHILAASTSGGRDEVYRTITVRNTGELSYLAVDPQISRLVAPNTSRLFAPLTTSRLRVSGILESGARFDMTADSETRFTSENPAVAAVSASGTVTAVAPGQTSIVVQNGTEYASAVVQVNLFEKRGDLDGDGDIDQEDSDVLARALNARSTGTDDPRDLTSDGTIDSRDVAELAALCTRPSCAANTGEAASPAPSVNQKGVVNAASFTAPVGRGSIVALFGSALSTAATPASSIPLPTSIEDVRVSVNGVDAPLFYVSPTQLNLQIPYETPARSGIPVVVRRGGSVSAPITITVRDNAPGIFVYQRTASILDPVIQHHSDSTLVTPERPAVPGEVLTIYATGVGALDNPPATGEAASGTQLATSTLTPTVTIGGIPAQVLFAGLTPSLVGLLQINIVVPAGYSGSGRVPMTVRFGAVAANAVNLNVR